MSGSEVFATAEELPEHVLREIANEPGRRHLALRSPAPEPAPDHAEQLVTVRAAIAAFRLRADQFTPEFSAAAAVTRRRADVLEHVLRRLIREGTLPGTMTDTERQSLADQDYDIRVARAEREQG